MRFQTLQDTPVDIVRECFNAAFAGYQFNMYQTPEAFDFKMRRELIDITKSVGAFDGNTMVGFIIFGIGMYKNKMTAWDGGTGVLPSHRGKQLTQKMFAYIQPILKSAGIEQLVLEVLQNNKAAHSIYEKIGFSISRELLGYQGRVTSFGTNHTIETLNNYDADELLRLGDWIPCWQQTNPVVKNWGDVVQTICVRDNDTIMAYAHFNTVTKRVLQFAVDKKHRRKGIANALFQYMSTQTEEPIMSINMDGNSENTNTFLKKIGFELFVSQYEMVMPVV